MESAVTITAIARRVGFHSSAAAAGGLSLNHRPLLLRLNAHYSHQIPRRDTRLFHKIFSSTPLASSQSQSHAHALPSRSASAGFGGGGGSDVRECGVFRGGGKKEPTFTAVLLAWLGAEDKHLKRYAELYRSRGFRVVTFVVPPWQLFDVDLGRGVERRVQEFTRELVTLVSENEGHHDHHHQDGDAESCLFFHTFSNTGWLIYGAILDNLKSRADIVEKIRGCVVDSGADPELSPQVWAAGFCAALLKKSGSADPYVSLSKESKFNCEANDLKKQDSNQSFSEIILLAILEKFFSFILFLPDVNRRLTKLIQVLSSNQPLCPQLFLYSSADKVIPYESIEVFIGLQQSSGRTVHSYNFKSSPHVDHLRSFPHLYSAEIGKFLRVCGCHL